ncbi:MAG TPA: sulfotransferase [Allosphingosinicella sp.]|jgi:hypothetical protein
MDVQAREGRADRGGHGAGGGLGRLLHRRGAEAAGHAKRLFDLARRTNVADFAWNRAVHRLRPGRKIFFIGFNKCATSSIHKLLNHQGVRSVHWHAGRANLALEIEARLADPERLAAFLRRWTAFSDLIYATDDRIIEGNRHFRLFHELFPDAYFVLNDRDPETWVASRMRHKSGQFASQYAAFHHCAPEALPPLWRGAREAHNDAVLRHFEGNPRFLHLRVDRDDMQVLLDFLAPDFRLRRNRLQWANVTGEPDRPA